MFYSVNLFGAGCDCEQLEVGFLERPEQERNMFSWNGNDAMILNPAQHDF